MEWSTNDRRAVVLQGFNIPSEGIWFWFEGIIDVFFYFDLALNFFTAYEVCHQGAAWLCAEASCTVAPQMWHQLLKQPQPGKQRRRL